jgi:hypothetical protein
MHQLAGEVVFERLVVPNYIYSGDMIVQGNRNCKALTGSVSRSHKKAHPKVSKKWRN